MKKINKQLEVKFTNIESSKQYAGMDRCKILVGYADDNRNRTNIKKEVWEHANVNSIKNIPIVGIYSQEDGRFKGHMDIDFDDEGLVITNPVPYGVVPESANIYWETIEEEDGTIRDYTVVDGALLWTKRYPEVKEAFENGTVGQSMEILVNDYEVDGRGYTIIKEMEYSSLCLLGLSEPCFESAKATMFTLDKEKFKQEFSLLLDEIKKFNIEEDDKVKDNKSLDQNIQAGNIDCTIKIESKVDVDTKKGCEINDNASFSLSHDELYRALREEIQGHYESNCSWTYVNDVYDNYVVYSVESWHNDICKEESFKANYTKSDSEVSVDFDSEVEVVKSWISVEDSDKYKELLDNYTKSNGIISNLESEKSEFESKISELEKSNNELYSFKEDVLEKQRIKEINSIESKFSKKLAINEVKSVKDKALSKEISVEEMEVELCKMFTNKSFELLEKEKVESPAIQVFSVRTETNKCPYEGLEHLFK